MCSGAASIRAVWRSDREKCSRFSTSCVSGRASWSMITRERERSSWERTRPSRRVSENMRIWASGVRSSWEDALATKSRPGEPRGAYSRRN